MNILHKVKLSGVMTTGNLPPLELATGDQNPLRRGGSADVVHPESLPQMPLEKLYEAGKTLTDGLEKMMPGLWLDVTLIEEQCH